MQSKLPLLPLPIAALCTLGGCGGSGGDGNPPAPVVTKYAIGGTVSGLPASAALTLTNGRRQCRYPGQRQLHFSCHRPGAHGLCRRH